MTREIGVEKPVGGGTAHDEDLAEFTALTLLHESTHAKYATTPAGQSIAARQMLAPILQRAATRLFNLLEDDPHQAQHGLGTSASTPPTLRTIAPPLRRASTSAPQSAAEPDATPSEAMVERVKAQLAAERAADRVLVGEHPLCIDEGMLMAR